MLIITNILNFYSTFLVHIVRTRSRVIEDDKPAPTIGSPIRGKVGVVVEPKVKVEYKELL